MIAYTYIYVSVSCALASARSKPHPTQRTERYNPRTPTDADPSIIVSVTLQDDPKKPGDSDDERTVIADPACASAGNASKTIIFYSLGLATDSDRHRPDDLHGIINRREHHAGSEV